jgi:hypothetical protein
MPGPLPRRVPQSAYTCFFLYVIGLPQQRRGSAYPLLPANTIFRGAYFRSCRHFFMFRPPSLLTSQIVPTPAHTAAGQLRLIRPSRTCFVTSACIGYACRPNRQLTARGLSPRKIRSLVGRSPLSTLRPAPRAASRKTQGQDGVAFSFLVGLFHSQQHAGLSRRTPVRRQLTR